MSEYIIKAADWAIDYKGESLFKGCEEIVRCRNCKYRYGCVHLVDDGDDDMRRCDATPDGFCSWSERRDA